MILFSSFTYDQDGYNIYGFDKKFFNREGLNVYTSHRYHDSFGIDINGLKKTDKILFDDEGYDTWGYDKDGFNKEGYDYRSFDKEDNDKQTKGQYNCLGFDKNGYHKETNTLFNPEGYNFNGFDIEGYDRNGFNEFGFDKNGIHKDTQSVGNKFGFNAYGIHRITGTLYDEEGYTIRGFDKNGNYKNGLYGYDENGFDEFGYDREGFTIMGLDEFGYDRNGYNLMGYDEAGLSVDGYDIFGFDENGYDKQGYDIYGFDKNGIHIITQRKFNTFGFKKSCIHVLTKTAYDEDGYTFLGYNNQGCNRFGFRCSHDFRYLFREVCQILDFEGIIEGGFDDQGFNREGYDLFNFNEKGIHKHTQTTFNEKGFSRDGIHVSTQNFFDPEGYNILGFDKYGYNKEGYDSRDFDRNGIHKITKTKYNERGFDKYKRHYLTRGDFDLEEYDDDGFSINTNYPKITTLYDEYIKTGNYEQLNRKPIAPLSFKWEEYRDKECSEILMINKNNSKKNIQDCLVGSEYIQQNEEIIAEIFDDNRFQDAFKISEVDENGYSISLPAIWNNYGFGRHKNGILFLTLKSAHIASSLYYRYLDIKAIVYDKVNKRLFIYEPDESCPEMAFKGSAWEKAIILKPEYEDSLTLEECYFELLDKLKDYNLINNDDSLFI